MVFFSVIIPVYNRANLVAQTINSVLKQEFKDLEIIIVDDGSTDDTLKVLQSYGDRVKILQQKNQGPGTARNLGLKFANGKYISFLDSDDFWFPWTLSTYQKVILNYNFPAFVAGKTFDFMDESELKLIDRSEIKVQYYNDYYASAYQNIWIGTCATALRKDVIEQIGGYCRQRINAEDSDLWLRLGTAKGFVHIKSPIMFAYRRHPNSEISDFSKSYEGKMYLIDRENNKQYDGQQYRERERLHIITNHIRPTSFECLKKQEISKGWKLYKATFCWHLKLMRIRYLLGFPVIAIWKLNKTFFYNCWLFQVIQFLNTSKIAR